MAQEASVLFYNFTDREKADKARFIFVLMNVRMRTVEREEYLKPIGALTGEEGITGGEEAYKGEGFSDEMLVIAHFTDEQLNQMISYFQKENIRVDLKAALTPTNRFWNSLELHDEIKREREEMERARGKRG